MLKVGHSGNRSGWRGPGIVLVAGSYSGSGVFRKGPRHGR